MFTAVACTGPDGDATVTVPSSTGASDVAHPQVLEERAVNNLGPMRLAEGVVPPTNRWYSSLAFGKGGLPVYPKPLSVTPVEGGFGLGLTTALASADAIMTTARNDVTVTFDGATDLGVVSHAGSVAVALTMGPATVAMAQGWPAVGITADEALTGDLSVPFAAVADGVGVATVDGREYGVVVANGTVDGSVLALDQGALRRSSPSPKARVLRPLPTRSAPPPPASTWRGASPTTSRPPRSRTATRPRWS